MTGNSNYNLSLALQLAARGWYVFPCREKPGEPYKNKEGEIVTPTIKSPYWHKNDLPSGMDSASVDPEVIQNWWRRWPGAIGGINLEKSGLSAIDIDRHPDKDGVIVDGFLAWAVLVETYGGGQNVPCGLAQKTINDGAHLIFTDPGEPLPKALAPGVEIKQNGYICFGRLPDGRGYSPFPGYTYDSEPVPMQEWILDYARSIRKRGPDSAPGEPILPKAGKVATEAGVTDDWELRPGDDYNARGPAWADVLPPGWVKVGTRRDGVELWRRPGKSDGVSAAIYPDSPDFFNVFTTSGGCLEPTGHTKFSVYAAYQCNGDFKRAAWALHEAGYGRLKPIPTPEAPDNFAPDWQPQAQPSAELPQAERQPVAERGGVAEPDTSIEIPELPSYARCDPALGVGASAWLDEYIEFSRRWSPRAADGFHEAVGLWVLSTIAARRVLCHMGKERFTNLYIALAARTSLFAKSSTAEIGIQTIRRAGLSYMLAADNATPQKFIQDLTPRLADNYDEMTPEQKDYLVRRVGQAGQRGWFYDEFGMHLAAMLREGGFMADFRGLIRHFDDTPERYEYGTIGRGNDVIDRPYLALLANLTPDDLKRFAKRGSTLWGDGFLARFATVTPPDGDRRRERFPEGERIIPTTILSPLVAWNQRLGIAEVEIVKIEKDGEPTGFKRAEIITPPPTIVKVSPDVREAFYAYHDGLIDVVQESELHDLDGNYARLAEKALRMALLFASLGGKNEITISHWARAQAITERWRAGLHELYHQINAESLSAEREKEERILKILAKHSPASPADVGRYYRGLSTSEAKRILDGLLDAGMLRMEGKIRYVLA